MFFFFNDTATTEIYTLSLHDALPISVLVPECLRKDFCAEARPAHPEQNGDRKSTRLNSSHTVISYAVFCLKKKKKYTDSPHEHPATGHLSQLPRHKRRQHNHANTVIH